MEQGTRERLKSFGSWLLTIAFEVGAGLMALKEAWVLVILMALIGLAIQAVAHFPGWRDRRKMIALIGMIVCGAFGLVCAFVYFAPGPSAAPPVVQAAVPTSPAPTPPARPEFRLLLRGVTAAAVTTPNSPYKGALLIFAQIWNLGAPSAAVNWNAEIIMPNGQRARAVVSHKVAV